MGSITNRVKLPKPLWRQSAIVQSPTPTETVPIMIDPVCACVFVAERAQTYGVLAIGVSGRTTRSCTQNHTQAHNPAPTSGSAASEETSGEGTACEMYHIASISDGAS